MTTYTVELASTFVFASRNETVGIKNGALWFRIRARRVTALLEVDSQLPALDRIRSTT